MKKKLLLNGFHWNKECLENNSIENNRISFLALEMSPKCHARCLYCFAGSELNRKIKETLPLQECKQIILEGKRIGLKTVVFPGIGEPILDPKLKPLIEYAHNLGLVSVIYTCGIMSRETVQFLRNHNVTLIIKIDSLISNHYEKLVGIPYAIFKESLDQIIYIYRDSIFENNGYMLHYLAANTLVTNINKDDIDNVSSLCKDNHILHFVESLAKVEWAKNNWKELVGENEAELAKIVSSYGKWVSSETIDGKCGIFSHGITIDVNGDIVGCPTTRWIRGVNVRNKPLQDLIKEWRTKISCSKKHYCLSRELSLSPEHLF